MFLIDREFREGRLPGAMKPFRYHFLYLLRVFVAPTEEAAVELGFKKTKEFHAQIQELLTDTARFRQVLQRIKQTISEVLKEAGGKYQGEAERRCEFTVAIHKAFSGAAAKQASSKKEPVRRREDTDEDRGVPRVRGTIKLIGVEFGFITDEKGQDVFFHRSQWKGSNEVTVGTDVVFTPVLGQKGLKAEAVREQLPTHKK